MEANASIFGLGGIFFLTKGGMCKSKITRGKLHSGSNRNRAGKLLQLPPLEFTGLHRLPPLSKSGRKTPSTTTPSSNSRDFIDYPPPRNRAGKLLNYLPPRILELTGVHPPQLLRCGCAPGKCFHDPGGIDAPA